MIKKIIISCKIEVVTGLHIGGYEGYSAIGMVDNVVIKDKRNKLPYIPGSSLKGKIRSLLSYNYKGEKLDIKDEPDKIKRLFGSTKTFSRLQFSDCEYIKDEKIDNPFEIKFENSIDRKNVKANPRQQERVIKGSLFNVRIVYNVEKDDDIGCDMIYLISGLKLLELDYLGGGGTRGNGRVRFLDFEVSCLDENCNISKDDNLTKQFKEIEEYGKKYYKI